MVKKEKIKTLSYNDFQSNKLIDLEECLIDSIDFNFCEIKIPVPIKRCLIKDLFINSCWFREGIILQECIIINDICYEMGGHNKAEIQIINNIFHGFFDFFDCHFKELVKIENNIFMKGSNFIGNKNKGYKNTFQKGYTTINNIGDFNIDY